MMQIRGREEGEEVLKGQREGRQWIGYEILKAPPPPPVERQQVFSTHFCIFNGVPEH